MTRIIQKVNKDLGINPPNIVTLAANTSTQILPDVTNDKLEYSNRWIQNTGQNTVYIAFDATVVDPNLNYHIMLVAGALLDCSLFGSFAVYGISTGGTTISTVVIRRDDLTVRPNIRNPFQ